MTEDYVAHCLELLSSLGAVRARRMFGGHGIYLDDLFIALLMREGRLFLKVDARSLPVFEAAGCDPFTYERAGATARLGYYAPPEEAFDSPAQMRPWARLALEAALRARAAQAVKKTAARKPRAAAKKTGRRSRAASRA